MRSQDSQEPNSQFTRRSETESICMFCSLTIQGDRYASVEEAESIHSDLCLMRPDSPVRYAIW